MNYQLIESLSLDPDDCLVVGLFANQALPDYLADVEVKSAGCLSRLSQTLEKERDTRWQTDAKPCSILVIHCGESKDFTAKRLGKIVHDIAQQVMKQRLKSITLCLPQLPERSTDWQLEKMLLRLESEFYQLLTFKQDKTLQHALQTVRFYHPGATSATLEKAFAVATGINYARTLANLPANHCTPSILAEQALQLATLHPNLKTTILDQEDMKLLNMGAFLAVAKGSIEPPKLIQLCYRGAQQKTPPIVLVGKGITFDSGGISIKPANGMEEMKYDMAGAASVLGTLKACAMLNLPINVVGLLACAENMPGGNATRPGDIVTTMSGQTVEIVNTDAEGRLVLADTLTFAEQFNPRFVIDMATLTGAIIVALGHINTGLMTADEALATLILDTAKDSEDAVWRMPLSDAYDSALESPLADMINAGFDRSAGSITAACFLSKFTKKYPWAHLDIAGTAWVSGRKNHATGRPVALLIGILRHVASAG